LTTAWALPACSTMKGVAHVVFSSRVWRHLSAPVAASSATMNRRDAFAEADLDLHRAQVARPLRVAVEVEGVNPARPERRDEDLAVGHGRRRREPVA
jgi:hypothetical protein